MRSHTKAEPEYDTYICACRAGVGKMSLLVFNIPAVYLLSSAKFAKERCVL